MMTVFICFHFQVGVLCHPSWQHGVLSFCMLADSEVERGLEQVSYRFAGQGYTLNSNTGTKAGLPLNYKLNYHDIPLHPVYKIAPPDFCFGELIYLARHQTLQIKVRGLLLPPRVNRQLELRQRWYPRQQASVIGPFIIFIIVQCILKIASMFFSSTIPVLCISFCNF